jgi:hypothetical protein
MHSRRHRGALQRQLILRDPSRGGFSVDRHTPCCRCAQCRNYSFRWRPGDFSNKAGHVCLINETIRLGERELHLDAELALERTRLMTVLSSNSWRLTMPLRELSRFTRSPKQQLRRYAVWIKNKATQNFQLTSHKQFFESEG